MYCHFSAIETGNFTTLLCFLFRAGLLIMYCADFIAARGKDKYSDVYNDNFRFKIISNIEYYHAWKAPVLNGTTFNFCY